MEFPYIKRNARFRVLLHNQDTAQLLAKAFLLDPDYKNDTTTGRVIIEAFPGPGVLSRAILQQPDSVVRKLILLEDNDTYLKYLRVYSFFLSRKSRDNSPYRS
jgi:transcription factor 1